jgi:hypothetical protein
MDALKINSQERAIIYDNAAKDLFLVNLDVNLLIKDYPDNDNAHVAISEPNGNKLLTGSHFHA